MQNVMLLVGAGQIGMAIARRMGYGMKIIIGDKSLKNAEEIAAAMKDAALTRLHWKWICQTENQFKI